MNGGWLFACGHFNPSTFLQIAKRDEECDNCRYAKQILAQAEQLRKKGTSAPARWRVVGNPYYPGVEEKR